VAQCAEQNIQVLVVPGPSAVVSALAISGLPTSRFTFEGFLSVNKKSRREHLSEVKNEQRTMIFYEAPHKLASTLSDMLEAWGDRRIAIVRELTKIHEEVIRTTLAEAAARFADGSAKGEIVLVIEGAPVTEQSEYTLEDAISLAKELAQSGISPSDAAKQAAKETGYKKGELYKAMLRD
jgi:16S rRNA (cytidine1402-2'-O)-methyltransferase